MAYIKKKKRCCCLQEILLPQPGCQAESDASSGPPQPPGLLPSHPAHSALCFPITAPLTPGCHCVGMSLSPLLDWGLPKSRVQVVWVPTGTTAQGPLSHEAHAYTSLCLSDSPVPLNHRESRLASVWPGALGLSTSPCLLESPSQATSGLKRCRQPRPGLHG